MLNDWFGFQNDFTIFSKNASLITRRHKVWSIAYETAGIHNIEYHQTRAEFFRVWRKRQRNE